MFQVKFAEKEMSFEAPLSVFDAAAAAELVSRAHLAALVDGALVGMTYVLDKDCSVQLLTFADELGKKVFRHSAAHVMAQAVKRLYPAAKLTIGPAIEDGFYYDFDSDVSFGTDALAALESEMKKIVKENHLIRRFTLPRDEAIKLMTEREEPYKVQLIEELPEGETISFYEQGEYIDLCAGPHLFSTGAVKAFKLTQCTGAYWKGQVMGRSAKHSLVSSSASPRMNMPSR